MPRRGGPVTPRSPMRTSKLEPAPMVEFKVRVARVDDARSVARLSEELGYPAPIKLVRERLRRLLSRDDQRVVVAETKRGEVCGWLQAHSTTSLETGLRVEIVGLIVSKAFRRMSVGRGLVGQAEVWASEISAETVVVRSNAARVESHSFYPSLGFLPSKTQVVYRKRVVI